MSTAAKSIYAIGVELLRIVGNVGSLRPVLASLFHRFLLYPPPQHRHEALKAVKDVLCNPQHVLDMAGPPLYDVQSMKCSKSSRNSDLDLLKLLMDGIVESSHSNESTVCHTSVSCIVALLTSLEGISQGKALRQQHIIEINKQFELLDMEDKKINEEQTEISTLDKVADGDDTVNGELDTKLKEIYEEEEDTTIEVVVADVKHGENSLEESEDVKDRISLPKDDMAADITKILQNNTPHETYITDVTGKELCDIKPIEEEVIHNFEEHQILGHVEILEKSSEDETGSYDTPVSRRQSEEVSTPKKQISAEVEMEKQRSERREELERIATLNAEAEKAGAREYVNELVCMLPSLIQLTDTSEVDETLLRFSSRFCAVIEAKRRRNALDKEDSSKSPTKHSTMPILNADGVYVATYSALLLNLKLVKRRHYDQPSTIPLSESEFINRIHDSVFLVYLSSTWLTELYNLVIKRNFLGEAGYTPQSAQYNKALITLLSDIDGLGNRDIGGQMLQDAMLSNQLALIKKTEGHEQVVEAGIRFAKRTLITIWDQVLDVLSVPLATKNITGVGSIAFLLGTEGAKEQNSRDREAIMMSLDGLRKAARLSCTLGVQDRCAVVLTQLANASCVYADPTITQTTDPKKQSLRSRIAQTTGKSGVRLHTSHVLSMDALLNMGLEIGSHSPESWKHVFRCCAYVSQLEHSHFSSGNTQPGLSITKVQEQQSDSHSAYDDDDLSMISTYTQPVPIQQTVNIHEIIEQNNEEMGFDMTVTRGGVLSVSNAAKAVYGLSSDVDRLYEESSSNLNLNALVSFLRELCKASQSQLFEGDRFNQNMTLSNPTLPSKSTSTSGKLSNVTSLHLFRLADVMLKCVRDGDRPLLHIMQAWSVVAPHFVEAACHKERQVSKKAVAAIHDILTELLSAKNEQAHFNFHESLFKPLESMLCLELCDEDVQDQIVSSICELVEASSSNIKSGWRPLFGALRAVKVHKQKISEHHTAPVFDVFEAFLNTDNVFVFANAAIDCILCLLKFVRGPGECELVLESGNADDSDASSTVSDKSLPLQAVDLCLPALDYLHRCHKILASIYTMPACPMFHGAIVTSALRDSKTKKFTAQDSVEELLAPVSIRNMDDESGIIRVWFLLLEGLTGAVSTCPRNYQPQTLELLFDLLRSITTIPGPQFAVFAVTNLLLPMLLSWVRRSTRSSYWDTSLANFKHACGLSVELVVDHVVYFVTSDITIIGIHQMIKQLFDLLIECIGQPMESISRLGCSCIRHVLLKAGPVLTDDMWTIACEGMQKATLVSLHSTKQLMANFHPGSDDFTGDVGQVKVAARRDCNEMEAERLRQIAQQVFLLDSQFSAVEADDTDDDRSYIFIIYPPDADSSTNIELVKSRIPFRDVVVGLMSNQILLQTLGTVLLYEIISNTAVQSDLDNQEAAAKSLLPGLLPFLSPKNLSLLLECFIESYKASCDFDQRPGLKFLLQKVAKLNVAVNLYRQTALSFTFYLHTLLELCHHAREENLVIEKVRQSVMAALEVVPDDYSKEIVGGGDIDGSVENGICGSDDVFKKERSLEKKLSSSDSICSSGGGDCSDHRRRRLTLEHQSSLPALVPASLSHHPEDDADKFIWVIKRLVSICYDACCMYVQLHLDQADDSVDMERIAEQPLFFLVAPLSPDEPTHRGKKLFSFPTLDRQSSRDSMSEGNDSQKGDVSAKQWSPNIKAGDPSRLEQAFQIKKDAKKLEKMNSRDDGRVYTVATNKTIKSLMQEYKKRKVHHSRSTFVKKPTFKEQKVALEEMKKQKQQASSPEEQTRQQEIIKQQKNATMKDSEAHMKAWSDMILSLLQLLQLLPDAQFKALLPATFPAVSQLICHVTNNAVRQATMEFMDRVARIHQIVP
ncbi:brefeldin A-inhibited guanine nucleotide-exchange protein 3-like [Saccoglossus kowalevskii]